MQLFSLITRRLSYYASVLAGVILVSMMGLTFVDVIGRAFGHPVKGAYDIMCMLGAVLAGFALPRASLQGAHVMVDLVVDRLSGKAQKNLLITTKLLGTIFFLIGAFYFILFGRNLIITNTLTMTLRFPTYPVAFCLATACLLQCLVLIYQIFDGEGKNDG
jgi:TRAP-type C4-dicarboxylate transport system permease small subunit